MNKKISTRSGIFTAMIILSYVLFLAKSHVPPDSSYNLIQFAILFLGLMTSTFFLYRYYAGITFMETMTHCFKTLATTLVLVIIGNASFFFLFSPKGEPLSNLTFIIMKIIFAYSVSGILSALIASLIFNTFTKK
jgi:hypothetical protein